MVRLANDRHAVFRQGRRVAALGWLAAAFSVPGCLIEVPELARDAALGEECVRHLDCEGGYVCDGVCAHPRSCQALLEARADTPSGVYVIQPDRTGTAAPIDVYCEMVADGGGWMLVTESMIERERSQSVTIEKTADANGGLVLQVFSNSPGCGDDNSQHIALLKDVAPWTELRARHTFAGNAACFSIFGSNKRIYQGMVNLHPFDAAQDTIRDQIRMGPGGQDAFDGRTDVCSGEAADSFWQAGSSDLPHEAVVVLRRNDHSVSAGPGVGISCNEYGAGTSSPTWWRYSDIYVR